MKTAWLIEGKDKEGTVKWFVLDKHGQGWSQDANDALKFADEKSAQSYLRALKGILASVTEHAWPDGF